MDLIHFGFFLLIAVGSVAAISDWRNGLFFAYVVGIVQDPMRKVSEGQPAYYVLSFTPIYAGMVWNLLSTRRDTWRVFADYPILHKGLVGLLAALALSAVITVANFGSAALLLVPLGLIGYVGLVPAIVVGYFSSLGLNSTRRLLGFAGVLSSLALVGVVFENLGYEWNALGPLNRQDWLHHYGYGKAVRMLSGFFRSPEIMGWHGAAVAMIGLTMFLTSRDRTASSGWLGVSGWGVACCLLSGRRKMLFMVLVYLATVQAILIRSRGPKATVGILVGAILLVFCAQFAISYVQVDEGYLELAATTFESTPGRLQGSTYGSFAETVRQAGPFGYGLGSAAQGIQHLEVERPRVWQEGGLAKTLAELGIPGLLALIYLGITLIMACLTALKANTDDPRAELLTACLFGTVAANGAAFIVAQQIFGDPFTLFLLGILIGVLLSPLRCAGFNQVGRTPGNLLLAR